MSLLEDVNEPDTSQSFRLRRESNSRSDVPTPPSKRSRLNDAVDSAEEKIIKCAEAKNEILLTIANSLSNIYNLKK